jgi:hypothetical protein
VKAILAISILFAAVSSLLAKEESAPLPPPASDKIFTFQQIEKQMAQLKDKVNRIEIESVVAGPGDTLADGTQRYVVEDTSKGVAPFGQVAFPQEALKKIGRKGPFTIYARIHVFPEKEAAAICVAVGRHVAVENGKATYSW